MEPGQQFPIGEIVLCAQLGTNYKAKILKFRSKDKGAEYFVHYYGWSNRNDEWVVPERVQAYVEGEERTPATVATPIPATKARATKRKAGDEAQATSMVQNGQATPADNGMSDTSEEIGFSGRQTAPMTRAGGSPKKMKKNAGREASAGARSGEVEISGGATAPKATSGRSPKKTNGNTNVAAAVNSVEMPVVTPGPKTRSPKKTNRAVVASPTKINNNAGGGDMENRAGARGSKAKSGASPKKTFNNATRENDAASGDMDRQADLHATMAKTGIIPTKRNQIADRDVEIGVQTLAPFIQASVNAVAASQQFFNGETSQLTPSERNKPGLLSDPYTWLGMYIAKTIGSFPEPKRRKYESQILRVLAEMTDTGAADNE